VGEPVNFKRHERQIVPRLLLLALGGLLPVCGRACPGRSLSAAPALALAAALALCRRRLLLVTLLVVVVVVVVVLVVDALILIVLVVLVVVVVILVVAVLPVVAARGVTQWRWIVTTRADSGAGSPDGGCFTSERRNDGNRANGWRPSSRRRLACIRYEGEVTAPALPASGLSTRGQARPSIRLNISRFR
jgi:hypothetical protein